MRQPLRLFVLFAACCFLHAAVAAPPVASWARNPLVDLMDISPSGNRYAFVQVHGEERILTVTGANLEPFYASRLGSGKVRDVLWADEDHVLVTLTTTFRAPLMFRRAYELAAVFAVNVAARKTVRIFERKRNMADVVMGYYGSSRADGHTWGYFGGITYGRGIDGQPAWDDGYADLYRVDLDSGDAERVARGDDYEFDWVIGPDGDVLAHSEYADARGGFRVYAGITRERVLLDATDPLSRLRLVGRGSAPRTVVYEDERGDANRIVELNVDDGRETAICRDIGVARYVYDPGDGRLLGCIANASGETLLFDPVHQARFQRAREAFDNRRMRLVAQSSGFDHLLVFTHGGDDSGTWWSIDMQTHKAAGLARAYADIGPAEVGPSEWFDYTASDGLALQGVLTLPPGREAKGLPLVLLPHGGPIGIRDTPGFDWWAQAFAARGYAVLQPNYRGSGGYSLEFENAGRGEFGGRMLGDMADGVRALAAKGIADPARACIVGASYGGYAALAGVTLQQGLYRCSVAVAPVTELASFYRWASQSGSVEAAERHWKSVWGIDRPGDPAVAAMSPVRVAARADAPVLLIHGKDDTVVPVEQSRLMESALKKAGKPVELEIMDGEDHWLSREKTRTLMLERTVAFVEKHNPPR